MLNKQISVANLLHVLTVCSCSATFKVYKCFTLG